MMETETETIVHWGCQLLREDGSVYTIRWDPGYGSGVYVPYTEAEARADVANPARTGASGWKWGRRLVTRTETTTVVTTDWVPVT